MLNDKEIIAAEFQDMIDRVSANLDSTGTTASGNTKKSLRVEITDFGVVVFARKYFKGVESGREAGNVPKGFHEIIKKWIINKGITVTQLPYKRVVSDKWQPKYDVPERSLNMAAGSIANSIKMKGTQLNQTGGRADIYSNEIPKTIEKIKKRLSFEIVNQIKINVNNGR